MIHGIRVKVCGLTSVEDAHLAEAEGADFLGFIFHEKSPRNLPIEAFKSMRGRLPARKTVGVVVEPSLSDAGRLVAAGTHLLQVHFALENWRAFVPWLVETVGAERLWLAPRTPEPAKMPDDLLELGKFFLIDGFAADKFGGTGHTSDWNGFRTLRTKHHGRSFILSGGLNASNVAPALKATDARWLDVNSGVESAPGIKDPAKLRGFFEAVRAALPGPQESR
jgi:phosphoribosylanthranilate isomerase